MKKNNFFTLALYLTLSFQLNASTDIKVNFDNTPLGLYQSSQLQDAWPNVKWENLYQRAEIVSTKATPANHQLKISYPKGAVGPSQGGGQFLVSLEPSTDLWLSYQVKFDQGFDFRLGGKLPGLTSGGSTYTGGKIPTEGEGWSARYMWRENGEAIIYLYHMNMPKKWGEDLALEGFQFKTGNWYTLTQHIRINDMHRANGLLEVWIDDNKVLNKTDIQYRGQPQALIDSFYFSTFHGGNTEKWGPIRHSAAYFDNFIISSVPLINLSHL